MEWKISDSIHLDMRTVMTHRPSPSYTSEGPAHSFFFRHQCWGQAILILCPTRQMPSFSQDVSFSAATWRIELPPHYRQRTDSPIWLQDTGSSVCSTDLKSFCAGAANTVFLRNIATAIPSLWFSRLGSLIPQLKLYIYIIPWPGPLTCVIWLNSLIRLCQA